MTTVASSQRLRCRRGSVDLSAEMRTADQQRVANLINLSGSGCLLHTQEPLKAGEVVFLRFSLPGFKEVTARGRVARVGNLTATHRMLGLCSSLVMPMPRANEEDHEFESGDRFFVGIAFEAIDERDTELIVHHVVREAERRRRAA